MTSTANEVDPFEDPAFLDLVRFLDGSEDALSARVPRPHDGKQDAKLLADLHLWLAQARVTGATIDSASDYDHLHVSFLKVEDARRFRVECYPHWPLAGSLNATRTACRMI